LISLGAFNKQGYNYSSEDGQIKISKCALTIMKGKLQCEIYTLMGNSMIRTVAISRPLD
jgi:hypothetical protein